MDKIKTIKKPKPKNTMKKTKFKEVYFKPMPSYTRYSWEAATGTFQWTFHYGDLIEGTGHSTFTETYIENHPELFKVDIREPEFEEGAWYKARITINHDWEIIRRADERFQRVNVAGFWDEEDFFEIGERIEL